MRGFCNTIFSSKNWFIVKYTLAFTKFEALIKVKRLKKVFGDVNLHLSVGYVIIYSSNNIYEWSPINHPLIGNLYIKYLYGKLNKKWVTNGELLIYYYYVHVKISNVLLSHII